MSNGWLVNDCLTCIPGTKTFWHDLLEWFPELIDKTNGYTNYKVLPDVIEREANINKPDYIIRNATFFRPLNISCKQIALLQDCYDDKNQQIEVCNHSDVTVFNSNFTYNQYKNYISSCDIKIIPLGVDFNLFNVLSDKSTFREQLDILPNSILFVGSSLTHPKGFNVVLDLINTTKYNFCLVMKDNFKMSNHRVRVFNKVDHTTLVKIYNSCDLLLCTSIIETQHLASIEAGGCNLPILTTNIGALYDVPSGIWGIKVTDNNFIEGIEHIKKNRMSFSPRKYFLDNKYDKESCKYAWLNLIEDLYR